MHRQCLLPFLLFIAVTGTTRAQDIVHSRDLNVGESADHIELRSLPDGRAFWTGRSTSRAEYYVVAWEQDNIQLVDLDPEISAVRALHAIDSAETEFLIGGARLEAGRRGKIPCAWRYRNGTFQRVEYLEKWLRSSDTLNAPGLVRELFANMLILESGLNPQEKFFVVTPDSARRIPEPFKKGPTMFIRELSSDGQHLYGSDLHPRTLSHGVVWNLVLEKTTVLPSPRIGREEIVMGGSQTGSYVAGIADIDLLGRNKNLLWVRSSEESYKAQLLPDNRGGDYLPGSASDVVEFNGGALIIGTCYFEDAGEEAELQRYIGFYNSSHWRWLNFQDFLSQDFGIEIENRFRPSNVIYSENADMLFFHFRDPGGDGYAVVRLPGHEVRRLFQR